MTQECPKPLLKVGDKAILELIIERFIDAGFHRFFISTHFMPEMIRKHFGDGSRWGVSIRYVHEEHPLGTGGALGLLPHDEIDLPIFMMNGDLLTSLNFQNLLDFHQEHEGVATICVREYEHRIPFGVLNFQGHRVTSIVENQYIVLLLMREFICFLPSLLVAFYRVCALICLICCNITLTREKC
ncbi:sugar phosphate nucleotidyltransferase [Legionella tunisiensis]|uniref:sugar phosphate nucleotidyltransferase n=1 Tax=Legionella tunisiensis TaxID=1034944 RepID=UPI0018DD0192|nr:sugar phosphate nucleotidyltransferase [Legionella tunisiensis]